MTHPSKKQAPGPTSQSVIAESLRTQILAGSPAAGTPLREEELAQQFSASRHTIRSALALLAAERLVETAPYRGARVARIDRDELVALQDLRCALESAAIRLLFQRYGTQWPKSVLAPIERATQALTHAEAAEDALLVSRAHVAFHHAIVTAGGTSRIVAAYEQISAEILLLTVRVRPEYPKGSLAIVHREYLEQVQTGDEDAVWNHLARSTELLLQHEADDGR